MPRGQPVEAWLSPGHAQEFNPPEPLGRNGIQWDLDWATDDLPYRMITEEGPLVPVARQVGKRLGMGAMLDRPASSLTIAWHKRLELTRALATGAKLLLLDEVMSGLIPPHPRYQRSSASSARSATRGIRS